MSKMLSKTYKYMYLKKWNKDIHVKYVPLSDSVLQLTQNTKFYYIL